MKKSIISIIAIVLFVVVQLPVFAQADGPGDPGGDPEVGGDPPLGAPLDGGTLLLLSLGVAYGIKKYHNYKNEEVNLED